METIPVEMQQKLLTTRSELQAVKARIAALRRTKKLAEMTQSQVHEEELAGRVWQGTGKMFMNIPVKEYDQGVADRAEELDAQLDSLAKKETYYATTLDKLTLAITGK